MMFDMSSCEREGVNSRRRQMKCRNEVIEIASKLIPLRLWESKHVYIQYLYGPGPAYRNDRLLSLDYPEFPILD